MLESTTQAAGQPAGGGASASNPLAGPTWDITSEYPAVSSPELLRDLDRAVELTAKLAVVTAKVAPMVARADKVTGQEGEQAVRDCQEASRINHEAMVLLWNVEVYLSCVLSVDARHAEAKTLSAKARQAGAGLEQAFNPVAQFLKLTSESLMEQYLKAPHTGAERFLWRQTRELRHQALPLGEEDLTIALDVDGPAAWGTLYDNLSGVIQCEVGLPDGAKTVGLAAAATMLRDDREPVRKAAHAAVNAAWTRYEEPAAAILNALSGWRLTMYKKRSHQKPVHFLDEPLHRSRIARATLDAMFEAVREARGATREMLKTMAGVLGKQTLAPWDLFAPCPVKGGGWEPPTFNKAIDIISESYGAVHPEMGAFVRMMAERRWIEGGVEGARRPGAYCTKFVKSRTPRVYMTYAGSMSELKTLAHELGHAFHNWVMRDMELPETYYPMTLAETASIFGETVVNAALLARANDPVDRLRFCWAQAKELEAFFINIPARFTFEQALYERRAAATLTPEELRQMMVASWRDWYGDSLSEMDPMFWASKLHFSIASLSFYNFPYTFGYLFALGVYAQRHTLGDRFYQSYVNLLRDTGRMTAEEVAAKHLGADLTRPDFWRQSIRIALDAKRQLDQAVADVRRVK